MNRRTETVVTGPVVDLNHDGFSHVGEFRGVSWTYLSQQLWEIGIVSRTQYLSHEEGPIYRQRDTIMDVPEWVVHVPPHFPSRPRR